MWGLFYDIGGVWYIIDQDEFVLVKRIIISINK